MLIRFLLCFFYLFCLLFTLLIRSFPFTFDFLGLALFFVLDEQRDHLNGSDPLADFDSALGLQA